MLFAAETLTDPAAQAAAQNAGGLTVVIWTAVISVLATSGLGGFFYWLWNRNKTNSDIAVNISEIDANRSQVNVDESVIIQNQYAVIAGLNADIQRFIEGAKALRDELAIVEAAKRAADRLIEDVKDAEALKAKQLRQAVQADKDKIAETIDKALGIAADMDAEIRNCSNANAIQRKSVLLVELLYYMKRQLTG